MCIKCPILKAVWNLPPLTEVYFPMKKQIILGVFIPLFLPTYMFSLISLMWETTLVLFHSFPKLLHFDVMYLLFVFVCMFAWVHQGKVNNVTK